MAGVTEEQCAERRNRYAVKSGWGAKTLVTVLLAIAAAIGGIGGMGISTRAVVEVQIESQKRLEDRLEKRLARIEAKLDLLGSMGQKGGGK